jgi:hypothetical protein
MSATAIPRYLVEPRPIHHVDFCRKFQREFKDLAFYEIVEGTSIYAFFQDGEWRLSCDDDKSLSNDVASFKDTCDALNVDLDRDLDKNFTYSFVFQTPYNKYVNSYLNSYEMYIDAIYRYSENDPENDSLIPCNLEDFTAYKYTYDVACYQKNRRILFPQKLIPNFDNLYLIVKEWGVGNGLPFEILDNDDYDRHAFIHKRSEKGIAMVHIPSGTKCEVLNRHYVKYIQKQQQQQEDTN